MTTDTTANSRQALDMLLEGRVEDAVALSGEELAVADTRWRQAYNSGDDIVPATDNLLQAAFSHIECLEAAALPLVAYSTTLVVLYASTLGNADSKSISNGRLILWLKACRLLENLIDNLPAIDESGQEHIRAIICYQLSMLYVTYRKCHEHGVEGMVMTDAYQMLDAMRNIVRYPTVSINGTAVNIDNEAQPLMADLLGRARAIGLFSVEQ